MMKTYLVTDEGARFWSISLDGSEYTVRYGKVGSNGRTIQKSFDSEEKAEKAYNKQVASKQKQGYVEGDESEHASAVAEKKAKQNEGAAPAVEAAVLRTYHDQRFRAGNTINHLVYSHDGSHILGIVENYIYTWDAKTGELRHKTNHGCGSYSVSIARLSQPDLFLVTAASWSSHVSLYNASTNKAEHLSYGELKGIIACAVLENDVLIAGENKLLVIDRKTNDIEQTFTLPLDPEKTYSNHGAFSPDGSYLACAYSNEAPVYVIDTTTGRELYQIEHGAREHAIAFSPDSTQMALFVAGEGLQLYDAKTGEQQRSIRYWEWHAYPQHMQYSPDGKSIQLSLSGRAICWDLEAEPDEYDNLTPWILSRPATVGAIAFHPTDDVVAIAQGRTIGFANAKTGKRHPQDPTPQQPYQQLIADAASGQLYAFLPAGQDSHILDTEDFSFKRTFRGTHGLTNPGQSNVLLRFSNGLGLLDTTTGKHPPISASEPNTVAVGPNMYAGTQRENYDNKWLRLWSLSGSLLATLEDSKKTCPDGPMCFSPDGHYLYAGKGKRLLVWDTETHERVYDVKEQPTSIDQMAISADGKWLATSDRYRNVLLWNTQDCTVAHSRKAPKQPLSLTFGWDGTSLIIHMPQSTDAWAIEDYQPLVSVPHGCTATSATLATDATLYVAGQDGSLRAIDGRALQEPIADTTPEPFLDVTRLNVEEIALEDIETLLRDANWQAFDTLRDTVQLRRFLQAVEDKHGVQKLHHDCTDQVLQRSKRLLHPFGHKTQPIESDISPCGRWEATGSWVGDNYDEGGELQIWERETGRCVNTIKHIDGGVGWPDYPGQLQWGPDSTQLGVGYHTNAIGNFAPFSTLSAPLTYVSVTDGGNRPPGWDWTPDGRACIVDYGNTCIAPFEGSNISERDVQWYPNEAAVQEIVEAEYSHFVDNTPEYGADAPSTFARYTPAAYLDLPAGMTVPAIGSSPLTLNNKDLGRSFAIHPSFPIRIDRQWHWCVAFPTGLVVASPAIAHVLDQQLAFTIENRFSWPTKWADERHYAVVSTFAEAVGHPLNPLSEKNTTKLAQQQPGDNLPYFRTMAVSEMPHNYSKETGYQVESFELPIREPSHYQANTTFEGADITQSALQPILGKAVLYAESYDPNRQQIGVLMAANEDSCIIYTQSPDGRSAGYSGSDYERLIYIGEALPVSFQQPDAGKVEEPLDPQEAERAQFPNGLNLSKHTNPDNERGELIIPLPFEGDDELILHWEKIVDFEVDEDFAEKWGKKFRELKKGGHFLGRFTYNGEPFEPKGDYWGAEHFHECRFDAHGNDAWGSNEDFDGKHGLNVTLLMAFVPKKSGQFNAKAPIEEIMSIRFGWKGSYKLNWSSKGGSKWRLEVHDEKHYTSEEILAFTTVSFDFDFFEMTLGYEHNFGPNDLWNTGE
jgi:WD40 repeat protein